MEKNLNSVNEIFGEALDYNSVPDGENTDFYIIFGCLKQ